MNVVTIVGTRPEAIKLGPVVRELGRRGLGTSVLHTGQHRDLVQDPFELFGITPSLSLDTMRQGQSLSELTALLTDRVVAALRISGRPDVIVVQGDTASTLVSALAGSYLGIPVVHVEAGLRTGHIRDPFPEEVNRMVVSMAVDHHFAPTDSAATNLLAEGVPAETITVTGNTVVDAVAYVLETYGEELADERQRAGIAHLRYLAMTLHRRESWGSQMRDILAGVRDHIATDPELHLVFPMHPNPEVRAAARDILAGTPNVKLVEPAGYRSFIALMQGAELIVTDSGGIQEEAPTLGKHTLVLRASTERSEGVAAGTATLVGVDRMAVREAIGAYYQSPPPAPTINPFGDGHASERIVDVLESKYR